MIFAKILSMYCVFQYTDNTCTVNTCKVSAVPEASSDFLQGRTTVQYTVEDQEGNKAQCSFNVDVIQDCEWQNTWIGLKCYVKSIG